MTAEPIDLLDDLFTACALAAFLDQAEAEQCWPDPEATRRRAYRYYEEALAEKNTKVSDSPRSETSDRTVERTTSERLVVSAIMK
jgi:hypothetical protein